MTDDDFRKLCNVYGFAPSRALRELIDCATAGAEAAEREACAKVCDELSWDDAGDSAEAMRHCAAAIRARKEKS